MSVSFLRLYTDIHRGEYEGFAKGPDPGKCEAEENGKYFFE